MKYKPQKKVYAEFFGAPGSGKSTIAHALVRRLSARGETAKEISYILGNETSFFKRGFYKMDRAMRYTIKNYDFLWRVFAMLPEYAFISRLERLKQWINVCLVLSYYEEEGAVQVIDQGIVQACASLCYRLDAQYFVKVLIYILRERRINAKFIYVKVSDQEILVRLQKRKHGKSRVSQLKEADERAKVSRFFEECFGQAMEILPNVITVDGMRPVRYNADKILRRLCLLNMK